MPPDEPSPEHSLASRSPRKACRTIGLWSPLTFFRGSAGVSADLPFGDASTTGSGRRRVISAESTAMSRCGESGVPRSAKLGIMKLELDRDHCYRALLSRDPRFDGRFFTGVKTTGIFCRPICPARTPRLENVEFYGCAAAAEAAGLRPCKRCRPEAAPGTPPWLGTSVTVSRALGLIDAGELDCGDLDSLAASCGVGGRHLSRLFREELGATPAAIAQSPANPVCAPIDRRYDTPDDRSSTQLRVPKPAPIQWRREEDFRSHPACASPNDDSVRERTIRDVTAAVPPSIRLRCHAWVPHGSRDARRWRSCHTGGWRFGRERSDVPSHPTSRWHRRSPGDRPRPEQRTGEADAATTRTLSEWNSLSHRRSCDPRRIRSRRGLSHDWRATKTLELAEHSHSCLLRTAGPRRVGSVWTDGAGHTRSTSHRSRRHDSGRQTRCKLWRTRRVHTECNPHAPVSHPRRLW